MPYGQMLIEANSDCHLFLPWLVRDAGLICLLSVYLRSGFTAGLDFPTVSLEQTNPAALAKTITETAFSNEKLRSYRATR